MRCKRITDHRRGCQGMGASRTLEMSRCFENILQTCGPESRREQAAGKSGDALVQALLPGLKSSYGTWGFFMDYAAADIEQTAQELLGTKRLPPNPGR